MGARTVDEETIRRWISENSPSPDGSSLLSATVELTDAQIKALPTTGIEIIATPGANKIILPFSAVLVLQNWQADYTNINANSSIQISSTNGLGNILNFIEQAKNTSISNILAYGSDSLNVVSIGQPIYGGQPTAFTGIIPADLIDDGLSIRINNVGSGNLTGGNAANTLKVTVYYVVVDL
jgi:hypothetical protein